ncbi:M43 family zinc metalloprotease [Carboxylicivirga sp. M1479]|uniref:M43 family zinc metalloprotease n=1 Tax=Carboxylicivirga sp. M1479 TaxID=2594476 RepID=UPI00163D54AA|nr:M43 family zinc metalloprotease [Carboxylicivirga sp. M1479]
MRIVLIIVFAFISISVFSQDARPEVVCSCSEVHVVPFESLKTLKTGGKEYHIPIVFHVFDAHNPEQRLNYETAKKVIELLNRNFAAKNVLIAQVQEEFKHLLQDSKIIFHLAKKDPSGNSTNGITYHRQALPGDNPGSNLTLKKEVNWNMGSDYSGIQRYLQVWVTNNVNGSGNGTGWAYLPNTDEGGKMAGIVYNYKYLYGSSSDNVFTHEVGHYLGLSHVFGSSYDYCGDDGIDDTPETQCFTWECKKGDLCNDGLVNTENFMDYSGCTSMFTKGQVDYMHYWLEHDYRSNLWSESNLKFAGVYEDAYVGLQDELETALNVYPNPSNGIINISGIEGFRAELFDVLGNKVKDCTCSTMQYSIPGIYFLRITHKGHHITRKIFIKRS